MTQVCSRVILNGFSFKAKRTPVDICGSGQPFFSLKQSGPLVTTELSNLQELKFRKFVLRNKCEARNSQDIISK